MEAKTLKYSTLFLIIANSGIPYFFLQKIFIIVSFLLSIALFIYYERKIDADYIIVLCVFIGVEILQDVFFGNVSLYMHVSTFLRVSSAYFIIKVLNFRFFDFYLKIISFFSIISLFFFIGDSFLGVREIFIPKITGIFSLFEKTQSAYNYSPNVILYTFNPNTIGFDNLIGNRNSGPFYEPGSFAIFIVLALVFNLLKTRKLVNKVNVILAITLATTFSTAGYAAFFTIIISYVFINSNLKYRYFLLFSIIVIVYYAYFNLSFMYEKVEHNIEISEFSTASRFGSALADFAKIKENPIIGYGKNIQNIYNKSEFDIELMHRNNGLTKLMVNYGILVFFFFFFKIYFTFYYLCKINKINKILALPLLISFLILGFSQSIFNYPLLYLFLFLPKVLKRYIK